MRPIRLPSQTLRSRPELFQQQLKLNGQDRPLDDVTVSDCIAPRPQCISIFIGKSTALSVARGSIEIHDDERIIITLPTVNVRVLLADAMGRLIDAYIPIEAPRYPFPAFVEFEAVVRRHDHDPIDHWQLGHYLP